mmetsp:Transcript_15402/g.22884  ORF Transcript_15402/g.22884 Transcript_15402/m.22884 type:complete len:200 (-) Transcript_15402:20-619(-)
MYEICDSWAIQTFLRGLVNSSQNIVIVDVEILANAFDGQTSQTQIDVHTVEIKSHDWHSRSINSIEIGNIGMILKQIFEGREEISPCAVHRGTAVGVDVAAWFVNGQSVTSARSYYSASRSRDFFVQTFRDARFPDPALENLGHLGQNTLAMNHLLGTHHGNVLRHVGEKLGVFGKIAGGRRIIADDGEALYQFGVHGR